MYYRIADIEDVQSGITIMLNKNGNGYTILMERKEGNITRIGQDYHDHIAARDIFVTIAERIACGCFSFEIGAELLGKPISA